MKTNCIVALVFTVFATITTAHPQTRPNPRQDWRAGMYRGLTVGVSTKQDAVRVLGKAHYSGKEQDTGIPMMSFDVSEPLSGSLVVYFKNGLIDGITLLPS